MIRINHFRSRSFVDGPGERAVLFVQGCPIECPGCQNRQLWSTHDGHRENEWDVADMLATLAAPHGNVTISGGEPFAQPAALHHLLLSLRSHSAIKHILVYTGFIFETLLHDPAMQHIDVLVDGPFVRELDDPFLIYRGSRNQRPIDVPASLSSGRVVTLDWSGPEIVIPTDGSALMPVGLAKEFSELGEARTTLRCGQTQ